MHSSRRSREQSTNSTCVHAWCKDLPAAKPSPHPASGGTHPLYTLPNEPSASSSRIVMSSSLLRLTSEMAALAAAMRSA